MNTHKNPIRTQRGQAIVLITIAIVGILAMTALAVDAGNSYANRRAAQSGSDNAALSAALAMTNGHDATSAARYVTRKMGYDDGQVTVTTPPGEDCHGDTPNPVDASDPTDRNTYYVQVVIRTTVDTYFGPIIGITHLQNCVSAIARGKPGTMAAPFWGNAVVGLDPTGNSYDSGNSNAAHWQISGGGIFANHNAVSKNSNSVTFPDGDCVTAVNTTSGFGCTTNQHTSDKFVHYPADVTSQLPPIPACDGVAHMSGGKIYPQAGHETSGSVWSSGWEGDYAPGVYCISNPGGNIHGGITGSDVTFYITATSFTVKFNGHGYIAATAPTTGIYKGVLIFSAVTPTPCTQNLEVRGEGSMPLTGTIFLPSACIDYRGNGTGDLTNSMMIGYDVTSNGNAEVHINYNPDDNYKRPEPPDVELTR